ncbi:MAG: S9 family peptidase [Gemmatimonadaceae bacterium]|nr:S9 family peptidase [Gemmatimonadaceae bacterium]
MRRSVGSTLLVLCAAAPLVAQSTTRQAAFTASDALDVTTWTVADLSADGRWIAATSTTRRASLGVDYRRDGDPSYIRPASLRLQVIDSRTGDSTAVLPGPANVRAVTWSPNGQRLGLLLLQGERFVPHTWDRATRRLTRHVVPAGSYVAENSDLQWTADGSRILVAVRPESWLTRVSTEFDRMTRGPIFVQDSRDPFLAWDALRRLGNIRSVVSIELASGRVSTLVPEGMISQYRLSADDSIVTYADDITARTDYDVIFGSEQKLLARRVSSGEVVTVHPTLKGMTLTWADDGRRYAMTREGRVSVARIGVSGLRQIAGPDSGSRAAEADTSATARAARANQRFAASRWSPAGDALLLTNPQGFWIADTTGRRTLVLPTDTLPSSPRYVPAAWSTDGRYVYFTYASRTRWERGLVRLDRTSGAVQPLVQDAKLYQGFRLARAGDVMVFSSGDGNRPTDLHVADGAMQNVRRLTNANPWLSQRTLARTELLTYRDVDGRTRYGVAYLPPSGTGPRPTLFNVYEDFFDDTFDATVNVLVSAGYVVVKPSVAFETGFPGEAWLKGVTSAANALIDRGIADSAKLGVFGTSYGGYATNLLITQTNRFKAAANTSGKVDLISFYTDSPRLGVRNIHAAEKSQDRIGATLWQQPQKYVAHSAIMFADRITTPLLLLTGEQDSNVPAGNSREMYYALRRLGKEVTWVNYMNSGHGIPGTNVAEFTDYHDRLLSFFGQHLNGRPAQATQP